MSLLDHLLANNRNWAASKIAQDPDFFQQLTKQQKPKYLWIGCADSRVPANQIIGLAPGEVFVHRNVANLVIHTDFNALSVIEYAVEVLKVEHIIVCGHYGCGGIEAATRIEQRGLVDNWLRHIQDIHQKYRTELAELPSKEAQLQRLCELNVREQLNNVCRTTIIQSAWQRGQKLFLHGWVYSINDGLVRELWPDINHVETII
ncbi:MAG: can [Gammaproteobacteria bacterium]|jgi:carbonic anhydrase|nr:can [Gammaproteobacteria bacterium]